MAWVDDLFTSPSLGTQWTAVTPDGDVHYPATGGSSVALLSNTSSNSIWTTAAQATRLEQDIAGAGDFELVTGVLDVTAEAGLFVRGSSITSDFVKFGRFGGQFTFGWGAGGTADYRNATVAVTLPVALKLVRTGGVWTAWYAQGAPADDWTSLTWTQFDQARTAAFAPAAAGLYCGGADSERFDYAHSTLQASGGSASGALGGLGGSAAGVSGSLGAASGPIGALTGAASGTGGALGHHPSSTLVMLAWLRQVAGLPASVTLPPPAKWFATGMCTIVPVGGNPGVYVPERAPVFQVDCWAANRASAGSDKVSRKIPHGAANELADKVVLATYALSVPEVTLPPQYLPAWIESAVAVSEVREIPEPDNSYAHYSVDVQLRWIERAPAVNL